MSIRLIVDSASDITEAEAKEIGVRMVPLTVSFGDESYKDGIDITHDDFYKKLLENDEFPKTSQVNPFMFEEVFREELENYDNILVIALSSKLSGTYKSACIAAEEFDGKVRVVDSLTATVAQRILIEYALRLIKEGKTIDELEKIINEAKKNIEVIAVIDTLKFLKKGGRIGAFAAFTGELLSIKPVVTVIDGEVKVIGKARGSKNGNNLLNKLVKDCGGIDYDMPYGTVYAGFETVTLKKYIEDSKEIYTGNVDDVPIYQMGSTIGTHIGPGGIGVAFFCKNKKTK